MLVCICIIKRQLHLCSQEIKAKAYTNLVKLHLEYSSAVWDPYSKCQINQMEKIKRWPARFVLHNYSRESSVTSVLFTRNCSTLQNKRKIARLSVFHKALHHNIAVILPDYLKKSTRHTRSSDCHHFIPPADKYDVFKCSFFPRTLTNWNSLNPEMSNSETTSSFKSRLEEKKRIISVGNWKPRGLHR